VDTLKITSNDIPVAVKVLVIATALLVPGSLIFWFHVVAKETIFFFLAGIIISVCSWTLKAFVAINFKKKEIIEGHEMLGLRVYTNYKTTFTGFEKIFINYIRSSVEHFDGDDSEHTPPSFKAFLKTCEGDKFCIAQGHKKVNVMRRVKEINSVLKTEVYDNTITIRPEIISD